MSTIKIEFIHRLEAVKQTSPIIKNLLEKSQFVINGELIPNVYQNVLKLFSSDYNEDNTLYPKFLIPFIHRDLNPENILVRKFNRGDDSKSGDFVLIDCCGEGFDKMGNRTFQELAVEFGKICFGFAGYNSIIYDDFQLENNGKMDGSFNLNLGENTNIQLVEKIINFVENHRFYLDEIKQLDAHFIRRIKLLIIISFLADLKYRNSDNGKIANLLQASVVSHKMKLFQTLTVSKKN